MLIYPAIFAVLLGSFVSMASKSWMVNLKDDVTEENMNSVEGWIVSRGGSVPEKMNHQDIKLLVAEMDQTIHDILKDDKVSAFVESIEDDEDIDHMEL